METFYRDQILSNAAVLFDTNFRIVLRSFKDNGKAGYEALLLEGGTHKVLASAPGGVHIQESLFNLLIELANQMGLYLAERDAKEKKEAEARGEGHKKPLGHEVPLGKSN
ncbi:hypothetical protein MBLNU459_g0947t2 [Dothideomycetes sp. NU459]